MKLLNKLISCIAAISAIVTTTSSTFAESFVDKNNVKLDLRGCYRKPQLVVCDLLITDLTSNNGTITILGANGTRLIDLSGDEYRTGLAFDKKLVQGVSLRSNSFAGG